MTRFLARSAYLFWLGLSAFIILTAITVSLFRMLLPLASDYRGLIQEEVSALVGRSVQLEVVKAEWKGLIPHIGLRDVRLFDAQTRELILSVGEAYVFVDLLASLAEGQLVLDHLGIVGIDLTVRRQLDGAVVLQGMEGSDSVIGAWVIDALITSQNSTSLHLLDSRVRWVDEPRATDYQFSGVNLSATTDHDARRLSVDIPLPKAIGNRLTLVVQFTGRLGETDGWNGRVYARAEGVRMQATPLTTRFTHAGMHNWALSLQSWSTWRQGRLARLTGAFSMHDAGRKTQAGGRRALQKASARGHVHGRVQWNRRPNGWLLQVADLEVGLNGREWPRTRFRLENRSATATNQATVSGAFSYINLQDVLPFLERIPRLRQLIPSQTDAIDLFGELLDTRLVVETNNDLPTHYMLNARIRDLGFSTTDQLTKIRGLDGQLELNQSGGELELNSRSLRIEYPASNTRAMHIDALRGSVSWQHVSGQTSIRSEAFQLSNEDLEVHGTGTVTLNGGAPFWDLRLELRRADGKRLVQILPQQTMTPDVRAWLATSILDAQVKNGVLIFKGHGSDFPFHNNEGEFHATLEIENGRVDYLRGWPILKDIAAELEFRNDSLRLTVPRAQMLDLELRKLTTRIERFARPLVEVDVEAHGPFADIASLLNPLYPTEPDQKIVKSFEVGGVGELSLNLQIPLSKEVSARELIQGRVVFEHTDVRLRGLDLALNDVNGTVHFGPEGLRSERLRADFKGFPLQISAMNDLHGSSMITINGQVTADALLSEYQNPFRSQVEGESEWFIRFTVPRPEEDRTSGPLLLEMWSDLHGTAVKMPAPLGKAGSDRRMFQLATHVVRGGRNPIRIRYGELLSAVGMFDRTTGSAMLRTGEIRFNQGEASLPVHGLRVRGTLPEIDLNAWIDWYLFSTKAGEPKGYASKPWGVAVDDIEVTLTELQWAGYSCDDLELRAHLLKNRWFVKLEGSVIRGDLVVPTVFDSGIPLVMNLQYLNIEGSGNTKTLARIDPRSFPSLRVDVRSLQVQGQKYSDLHLEASRIPDGLHVHGLQVSADELKARLSGDWRMRSEHQHRSNFRVALNTDNLGDTLNQLKLESGFEEGIADIILHLHWPDTPYRIGYTGLYGRANVELTNGNLVDIELGPGRVLGLVNMSAISRRLTLNFRDLFSKGFAYDEVVGNFSIVGSDVYTNDLRITGPSANIAIIGRTGLQARDHDQIVTVTPQVGSGLPVAGAILGGPGVGAAVFVADRLFKKLGPNIDTMSRFKYRISGSWDEPVINQVELPQYQDSPHPDLDSW